MLAQVHAWVAEAGRIALELLPTITVRRKADRSPVTEADERIETMLRQRIASAFPGHAVVGEEHGGQAEAEYVWALDPVDGTANFVAGLPMWGVSVGVLRRGVPVLGCVFLPAVNEWYEADLDGPARFNGVPVEVVHNNLDDPEAHISAPSNVHRCYTVRYPGKLRVLGSVAAQLCYVARGATVGAVIGRASIWDIAGGLAVLARAGGAITYLGGEPVDLLALAHGAPAREPMIAGAPATLAMLRAQVALR